MKEEDIKALHEKVERLEKMVEGRLEELKEMVDVVEVRLINIEKLIKKRR